MSRAIEELVEVKGTLLALTPLHVGAALDDLSIDMPVAINGEGKTYIPGTSLAGAMAKWWRRAFGETSLESVWGIKAKDPESASFLYVHDAPANEYKGLEIRDGVGIDRMTGAAADKIKYDRQIVPAGSTFCFKLVLEVTADNASAKDQLAALLQALENGHIRVGAAKTRGLGRVKLQNTTVNITNFRSIEELIASIENPVGALSTPAATLSDQLTFKLSWTAVLPTFSAHGVSGVAVDTIPLTAVGVDGKTRLVLPGAGVKGVFRSHGERIIRTLKGAPPHTLKPNFLEQISDHRLVDGIFGTAKQKENSNAGQGTLICDDTVFGPEVANGVYEKLFGLEGTTQHKTDFKKLHLSDMRKHLQDNNQWQDFLPYQHVGIDRWTGGSADGALYSVLEPPKDLTLEMEWQLDCTRLGDDENASIGFLLLLLREAKQGRIAFGFGVNRGRGTLHLTNVQICKENTCTEIDFENLASHTNWATAWAAKATQIIKTQEIGAGS